MWGCWSLFPGSGTGLCYSTQLFSARLGAQVSFLWLHTGWLNTTGMDSLTVLEAKVQIQGVWQATLCLKTLGGKALLAFSGFWRLQAFLGLRQHHSDPYFPFPRASPLLSALSSVSYEDTCRWI